MGLNLTHLELPLNTKRRNFFLWVFLLLSNEVHCGMDLEEKEREKGREGEEVVVRFPVCASSMF